MVGPETRRRRASGEDWWTPSQRDPRRCAEGLTVSAGKTVGESSSLPAWEGIWGASSSRRRWRSQSWSCWRRRLSHRRCLSCSCRPCSCRRQLFTLNRTRGKLRRSFARIARMPLLLRQVAIATLVDARRHRADGCLHPANAVRARRNPLHCAVQRHSRGASLCRRRSRPRRLPLRSCRGKRFSLPPSLR